VSSDGKFWSPLLGTARFGFNHGVTVLETVGTLGGLPTSDEKPVFRRGGAKTQKKNGGGGKTYRAAKGFP